MARAIDRGANRIDKIVQELLDISQLQLGKFTLSTVDFDLGALVGRVVRRVASTSTAHVLRFDPPKAVLVRADPHRIEWIVTHILENALRYSPGGGVVEIGVARGDTPTLSIRDSGVGIPVERQLRIFERFYRAHTGTPHDVGGLGVSLYISREIVHRSGGEMWFESEPGKGSTFFVRLPGGAANGADTHDRPRRG